VFSSPPLSLTKPGTMTTNRHHSRRRYTPASSSPCLSLNTSERYAGIDEGTDSMLTVVDCLTDPWGWSGSGAAALA
jgi:hypothetical protein